MLKTNPNLLMMHIRTTNWRIFNEATWDIPDNSVYILDKNGSGKRRCFQRYTRCGRHNHFRVLGSEMHSKMGLIILVSKISSKGILLVEYCDRPGDYNSKPAMIL